ncbi:hypothetical protein Q787_00340 [Ornithobacterium rhinotracheale H06-030791]|nr:hypothetical protein Q785_00390 [Ornithobacterium rhinotracheale ORT-UMN 88]KGB67735.1 hypothetical protein Q787_00340 [Ornithobacterium rhinotracheale H06-030791]
MIKILTFIKFNRFNFQNLCQYNFQTQKKVNNFHKKNHLRD